MALDYLSSLGSLGGLVGGGTIPADATPEALKRRRAVQAAIAAQKQKMPTTLGEGMTYLGEAVGQRMADDRLTEAEKIMAARDRGTAATLPGVVAAPVAVAPAAMPVAVAPAAAPAAAPATFGGKPYTEVPVRKSEGEGEEGGDLRDKLAALLLGNGGEVPQTNPTPGAELPPLTTDMQALPTQETGGQPDPVRLARRGAIGGIESGGQGDPYQALGAETRGDRAYGKYQVMGRNVPEWTQAALGQRMTPAQFLASKEAQDAVFDHRFGQYADKYGEEGAARAWYGGERGMKNLGATDVHGRLTVGGYGQDYMNRLRGGGVQTASLGGTVSDARSPGAGFRPPAATVTDDTVTPTDIKPMPVRTAQVGAPPSGVLPGSDASMFAPPAFRPTTAPRSADTSQGIPPAPTPVPFPKSGPAPTPTGITPDMKRMLAIANDPMNGDVVRAEAARRYTEQKKVYDDAYTRSYNAHQEQLKAEREYTLADPKTRLELERAHLANLKARRDIGAEPGEQQRKAEEHALKVQEHQLKVREAQAKEQVRVAYGNLPEPIRGHLDESKKTTTSAVGSLEAIRNARQAMEAGTVFGIEAPIKLNYYRVRAMAGDKDAARIVAATETYQTSLGPLAADAIRQFGGAQISNEDRRVGMQMSGADITRNEISARRMLDTAERFAEAQIKEHRQKLDSILKDQPPGLRTIYDVRDPLPGMPLGGAAPKAAAPAGSIVDVGSEAEAEKLPKGTKFRLNGKTGTVQ